MQINEDLLASRKNSKGGKPGGLKHAVDGAIDFTGGAAGAVACVYTGQPLDTIKVKMQTFPGLYKNAFKCFIDTLKNDGVRRGLYAGTLPALIASVAENAVLFAAYGFCQKVVAKLFHKDVKDLNPLQNACSGSMAAVFSTLTLCPTELVKCRLQATREMHAFSNKATNPNATFVHIGPWSMTKKIFLEQGFLEFYKGFWTTFLREVPGYFFFFGAYEFARKLLTPEGKSKDELGALRTIVCGGLAGASCWSVIFPFDVLKSRIQVQGGRFFATANYVIKTYGIRALYKGLGPTVVRSFFATGAQFVAFENTKKQLHHLFDVYV